MWKFKISSGQMFDPDGNLAGSGYAGGNCGKNPDGKNNPADESLKNIGPLPEGTYTFGTPVEGSHLGPFAIPLISNSSNTMYGRGGFFCHGDTNPPGNASEGCIIMPRVTRGAMWESQDHTLQVVS